MRLVIMGPQGAGKGTQAARLTEKYAVPSLATGDIFRAAIKDSSELGARVREYVNAGKLVPDELTIEVVRERLGAGDLEEGFLLDGFPRNTNQARALDESLAKDGKSLDAALFLEVPEDVSLRRILGRRVCSRCGRNYSVEAPPREDWTCDSCGGQVLARDDDQLEATVRERLKAYYAQTKPLKDYYSRRRILRSVEGSGAPDEVFDRIVASL
jgi:adenylate kinase